jgi:hypothetical protein
VAERSKAHDWKSCRVNSPPGFESLPFRHFLNVTRSAIPPRSALVLAACALLVLAFAPAQYFARQQDDALFLIGARALTSGRFCVLTSPGCPALISVDPGWSLLLTPLALFTDRPGPFQALSAFLLCLAPAALWFWLRRRTDETTALLGAALFASCPLVLEQSGTVMSETPYVLVLLAVLCASESGDAAWTGGLSAALLLLRTAGLGALPGLMIPFARRRRARDQAAAVIPPALAAAGWWAWCLGKTGAVGKFQLLPSTYGQVLMKPFTVAAANIPYYLRECGGCFLPPSLTSGTAALILGGALAIFAARGLFLLIRRRRDDPAAWSLIGSALLLMVWGWQYERYLLPLLPLLLLALSSGLGRAAKPALGILLALQLGAQTLPRLGKPSVWAEPELARTYAWLAARPRPALLVSAEPVRDGWLSGMPSAALPLAPSADEFATALKLGRADYVLRVEGLDYGLEADPDARLRRGLETAYRRLDDGRLFRKLHEEPAERAVIYAPR